MRRAAIRQVCVWALSLFACVPTLRAEAPPSAPLRDRVLLGAYVAGIPYAPDGARAFARLERRVGSELPIVSGFVDWDYVFGGDRDRELMADGAHLLLYSWEPHCKADGVDCIAFADVIAGEHDAYFARIADSMRSFPHVIYVRPWAEMNAEWSPWQPGSGRARAGSTAEFVRAFRHVRSFFRDRNIDNLKFVFNPDASNGEGHTPIADIWPGADYVDVLGIDGYNWGRGLPGGAGEWRSFEEIFEPMYRILTELHPRAPVWVCEFGSKEPTKSDGSSARPAPRDPEHSKGAWFEAMLSSTQFPRMTALVHFNVHKERDFRFESSANALRALRKQLRLRKGPYSTRTSRSGAMPASKASKQRSTSSSERPSTVSLVR